MTRTAILLLAALLLIGCPKPKTVKKTAAAPPPGPPGSVATTGAVDRAKAWIRAGGTDAALTYPSPPEALAGFSMTTPLDLKGKAVKAVTLRGAVSRGPGKVVGLPTFTMHDKGGVYENVVTYEVTFELVLDGGGGSTEVTTSLRPHQGKWYVLAPAPRK